MRYKQGKYTPEHPEKYIGDSNNIVYRSSWEFHLMRFCDKCPSILKWNSEGQVIPYYFDLDEKVHRYFVDFVIEYKDRNGNKIVEMIEVKPEKEYNHVIKQMPDGRLEFREDCLKRMPDGSIRVIDTPDRPPEPKKKTKKSMNNYLNSLVTMQRNKAKWKSAKEYAEQNGMGFRIMTEAQLGLKK